jgi:hypothetical protein
MSDPTTTSLKKCIPSKMRLTAMQAAQINKQSCNGG